MREFVWGYFSEQAAESCGSVIYESLDGTREIEVTCVSREDTVEYYWSDKIPVGPVPSPGSPGSHIKLEDNEKLTVRTIP